MKERIIVNPNIDIARNIISRVVENDGYCPCTIVKMKDTKCICEEFKEQTTEGFCSCGLYYKEIHK